MTTYGFLSTYPPTRCGLATFTSNLASAIAYDDGDESLVVRVDDLVPTGPATPGPNTRIVGDLHPRSAASRHQTVELLNQCDVVIVQHEYGIYGGRSGVEVLDILEGINVDCFVVLHTVLERPTWRQRRIIQKIAGMAKGLVAMTRKAKDLLIKHYGVSESLIHVIPHGVSEWIDPMTTEASPRPVILGWGLLGPGKGIEWGIRAMPELADLNPRPLYRVLGQTHPKVLRESGNHYRNSLLALAHRKGVSNDVELDGRYQETDELAAQVAAATAVLLAYDSRDQSTSGVLVEAVAAGKIVIATRFPHAVELLSDGAGILVDHANPHAIAQAIRTVLTDPQLAHAMSERARAETVGISWSAVASRYRALSRESSLVGAGV
ncbi:MAG: glycosyltransferase [Propionibacteriaceae bacterium]|jgi:glycosyltransferase involved in cell wall biosynthesis|nr:glycosyltransferase [Propionibacteriaceae bacterium]